MSSKLGMEGVLYRNTGTFGAPVWNDVPNVKDLSLTLDKADADVTTRGNAGWRAMRSTLKEASVEFQMVHDPDDVDYQALRDAWVDSTVIEFAVLDSAITVSGASGVRASMDVKTFSRSENLEEAMMTSVTIRPTYATNAPMIVTSNGTTLSEV